MKILLALVFMLTTLTSYGAEKSCGVRETAASLATIDMELDLLYSGLYHEVRVASMKKIARIVKGHLLAAQPCDPTSESLKASALETIETMVLRNTDSRNYSISTASMIFRSIRLSVAEMDKIAAATLNDLIENANK